MKKIVIIAAFIVGIFGAVSADSGSIGHYRYVKVADQWLVFPGVGVGYRSHTNHHGLDADLTAYSYWDYGFSLWGKGHYLFYPTKEHFYMGIGAGVMGAVNTSKKDDSFIAPTLEGVIGYEWNVEKRPLFVQLEVGVYQPEGWAPVVFPVVSVGMKF